MIPEEDRPASWLRGYGTIEADIRQMREFAAALETEVRQNYVPHLSYITDDMLTKLPDPADAFIELVHFLQAHHEIQQATSDLVHALGSATGGLATAADSIAQQYADTDAFTAARVEDVERALRTSHATIPPPPPVPPGPASRPEVLP